MDFTAHFHDKAGKELLADTLAGPLADERNGQTQVLVKASRGRVPKDTVKIVLELRAIRVNNGSDNDGFADNLSLGLNHSPDDGVHATGTADRRVLPS